MSFFNRWRRNSNNNGSSNSNSTSYSSHERLRALRRSIRRYRIRDALQKVIFPWGLFLLARRTFRSNKWVRKKREKDSLKPPKVGKRKRALSLPLEEPQFGARKNKTKIQDGARLMNLPAELRLKIWEEYLGKKEVFILLKGGRLTSFRIENHEIYERFAGWEDDGIPEGWVMRPRRSTLGILPLLQSCRVIYSEVIHLVYHEFQFSFCDIWSFSAFSASLLPQRFETIRHIYFEFQFVIEPVRVIHSNELYSDSLFGYVTFDQLHEEIRCSLDYTPFHRSSKITFYRYFPQYKLEDRATMWDVACHMLNDMKGLKSFKMVVSKSRFSIRRTTFEKGLFEPLKGVMDRVDCFDVEIQWFVYRYGMSNLPGQPAQLPQQASPHLPLPPVYPVLVLWNSGIVEPTGSVCGRLVDGKVEWRRTIDDQVISAPDYESDDESR